MGYTPEYPASLYSTVLLMCYTLLANQNTQSAAAIQTGRRTPHRGLGADTRRRGGVRVRRLCANQPTNTASVVSLSVCTVQHSMATVSCSLVELESVRLRPVADVLGQLHGPRSSPSPTSAHGSGKGGGVATCFHSGEARWLSPCGDGGSCGGHCSSESQHTPVLLLQPTI